MSISYEKLWTLIKHQKLNKTQLRDVSGITSATLARLSKDKGISLDALERICRALECEVGDVLEFKIEENKK
ncbi:Hypothetical protein NCDO2118_1341 [Lactococcus lactis subsp. lactis NCDO 2118]|uniref:HTH cro/C1-type domain-containing protein n=1 Tax=Lactococcus lactis subsp. lactis NCDO 2118 TaxID=1117941 RepID=A0ABC8A6A9_LACLL|nr:helix-turn-helix domain-containing protein [Lactococcus lactis]ADA65049.1 Transcriptional regulator, XRE family [Lactococcus lactis subsp. lactis KF147]AII12820.1 Hypothetical protein NCDO2118_1341 [Lactococcus lactis subsp. lactis NCDO 2118]